MTLATFEPLLLIIPLSLLALLCGMHSEAFTNFPKTRHRKVPSSSFMVATFTH